MHVTLIAGTPKNGGGMNGPNVAGVEVFEMRRVERVHLESSPSPGESAAADANSGAKQSAGPFSAGDANAPVEITCRGPFSFNVVKRVASFADNVDVVRLNPNGPSDQIQGDLLSMYFIARDKAKADSANSPDLDLERLEMRGHPVTVNAPTQNVTARSERLEYNLKTNLISLDGGPEVFLRQGPNEIHGHSLQYQSLGPNRLGRAAAQGPGWLRDKPPTNPTDASTRSGTISCDCSPRKEIT